MKTLEYLLPAVVAVLVHELGHLFMMSLLGVRFLSGRSSFWGIKIKADYTKSSYAKELLVSAFGIFANFLCTYVFFVCGANEYAYASLAYGIFNLLPAHFLDGGDIVRTVMLMSKADERAVYSISRILSIGVTVILWIAAVYFAVRIGNITLLITVFYMMFVCFFDEKT